MFYGSYEIHKKILNTIVDDKDNDIIFIVGKKGINKTGVLKEIEKNIVDSFYYSYGDFDLSVSCSFITHCFMDLLDKYTNTRCELKRFKKYIRNELQVPRGIVKRGKLEIFNYIAEHTSIATQKKILAKLEINNPFVILANWVDFQNEDFEYLGKMANERWSTRITYIIIIQPNSINNKYINEMICKSKNIVFYPFAPKVISESSFGLLPYSEIIIYNNMSSLDYFTFQSLVYSNDLELSEQIELFNTIDYRLLPALAYLKILKSDYIIIDSMSKYLFNNSKISVPLRYYIETEKSFVLTDSLSYYILMRNKIEDIIFHTQHYFFSIITNVATEIYKEDYLVINKMNFIFYKPKEDILGLKHIQSESIHKGNIVDTQAYHIIKSIRPKRIDNSLFEGYYLYYRDFSQFTIDLLHEIYKGRHTLDRIREMVDVLSRYTLDFSKECLQSLIIIHYIIGYDYILELGLNSINCFLIEKAVKRGKIHSEDIAINCFLDYCKICANKNRNKELINHIIQTGMVLDGYDNSRFKYLLLNSEAKNIIFLSHASKDNLTFVDQLYEKMNEICDVWYDKKKIHSGDSIKKEISNGVSKCIIAVLVISEHYFDSVWCEQEIKSLLIRQNANNENIVIPILYNISESQLIEKYPLLNGYDIKPIEASVGISEITIKIARILLNRIL